MTPGGRERLDVDLELASVRDGEAVDPDVSNVDLHVYLASVFPKPPDEEKNNYLQVVVLLPCSDVDDVMWIPKDNKVADRRSSGARTSQSDGDIY